MEMSTNLKIQETKLGIMTILSQSGLPAMVSQMIMNECTLDVNKQAAQIYANEKNQYEASLTIPVPAPIETVEAEEVKV